MSEPFHSFIHLLFIGIIALFPVVNPIGSALIVNPYLSELADSDRKNAVRKITLYAFCICIVSLFSGHWILELFGISVPVIQIAGGIMICKMGWDALSSGNQQNPDKNVQHTIDTDGDRGIMNQLFYPLTFPITTGAGTISVLFTLSAHSANSSWSNYVTNTSAIILAIIIICAMVYFFYSNTRRIVERLSTSGQNIVNRIFSFLIFCVGLQIALAGIKNIFNI